MIAVFLTGHGISVTLHSVMWVMGGNSIANTVSVTPGGVGVNQDTGHLGVRLDGGKLLVEQSYTDAKVKVEQQRTSRAEGKATKRAEHADRRSQRRRTPNA